MEAGRSGVAIMTLQSSKVNRIALNFGLRAHNSVAAKASKAATLALPAHKVKGWLIEAKIAGWRRAATHPP
jgi:hypothetical protein